MKNIKQSTIFGITFASIAIAIPTFYSAVHAKQNTFTGTVERVWEDGFRLNTGDRSFRVDSWQVCGDNTMNYLSANDSVKVLGEFSGLEFDAFSIADEGDTPVCTASEYRE